MKQSQLQLEHYTLTELAIRPYEGFTQGDPDSYPSFNDADFASAVEFGPASREGVPDGCLWGIKLKLKCSAKDGKSFPYRFEAGISGFLNGARLPKDNRSNLVLVNGSSLLYGALRDEILRLTARMDNGALMLPTVQFSHLAENAPAEAAAVPAKPARKKTKAHD